MSAPVVRVRTIAILLDICAAVWSAVLALWWVSGPIFEPRIAQWIWLFVPIFVIVLASRMLYRPGSVPTSSTSWNP